MTALAVVDSPRMNGAGKSQAVELEPPAPVLR